MSTKDEIAVSYDVGNDFFRLWLDERMNYTCAVFDETDDLEEAQLAKLATLYEYGKVTADSRVLDIGCGWGANLEYLAVDRGVRDVHGITLSEAQHAEILARRIPGVTVGCVSYLDYAPPTTFDAIMSICMIEHVCTPQEARKGEAVERYRDYFQRAWKWSSPGAHFALQCILRVRTPRDRADIREIGWASRHQLPGGLAPRMEDIVQAAEPYWEILHVRTRRLDYRRTCEHWRARLRQHEAVIRDRWGDRLFEDYDRYMTACVRGFEQRYLSLAQWSLRRLDNID
ncbi:cyclopropane-fatty-acyl-phospholipid synthase family protein [Nonomuraea sp. NPDC048882]|uniref:cyclopropane-fatty-acyl-phospholipid synthase family protein n=1 Tax=Nonomuraea sp. NPDC048882 TaxID=3154347 RepID=UPI0033DF0A3D